MIKSRPLILAFAILCCGAADCAAQATTQPAAEGPALPSTAASDPQVSPYSATPVAEDNPRLFPDRSAPAPALDTRPTAPRFPEAVTSATESPRKINIHYTTKRPVEAQMRTPDGKVTSITRYVIETQSASIDVAGDLSKIELPPAGKRAAVLAVTAARHQDLLDKLKAAETPEQKEEASQALKENYIEHYAIETWWREQKLSELEARLQELRAQVTQRQESEEKYVGAAMTIAELWADGIGITPPTPHHAPAGSVPRFEPLPGPTPSSNRSAFPIPFVDQGTPPPTSGSSFNPSTSK